MHLMMICKTAKLESLTHLGMKLNCTRQADESLHFWSHISLFKLFANTSFNRSKRESEFELKALPFFFHDDHFIQTYAGNYRPRSYGRRRNQKAISEDRQHLLLSTTFSIHM